jgi:heme-degrading monooxygenase HmoA
MYARVTKYRAATERSDEAASAFQRGIDQLRQMEGIRDAYVLVDRQSATAITMTLWESEEAMRASSEAADRVRSDAAEAFGATIESVEMYEVAMHETFGG